VGSWYKDDGEFQLGAFFFLFSLAEGNGYFRYEFE
jgi:hypothetical protein